MLFNVSGLIQEGIGATRSYEVDGAVPLEDGEPEHVDRHGRAAAHEGRRAGPGAPAIGRAEDLQPLPASRLEETVEIEFEEEFISDGRLATGARRTAASATR